MLSILIPVYNYNITSLVSEIHKQAIEAKVIFEIICYEDGSNKNVYENESSIKELSNTSIINCKTNYGRIKSRQILSNKAIYDWLLFLDADVIPKNSNFIETYIDKVSATYDSVYGGIVYNNILPKLEYILRWKYGKKYEEVNAKKRNLKPFRNIASANFLIKKDLFNSINSKINKRNYGLDNYFGSLLKYSNNHVLHINNEVYHLGLEENHIYLKKTEQAAESLLWLKEQKEFKHDNKLLSLYLFFKRYRLNYLLSFLYKKFNLKIKKNLLSNNPNMFFLQFYKIAYMCFTDIKQNKTF